MVLPHHAFPLLRGRGFGNGGACAPTIVNISPDSGSGLNRGFVNDALVYTSRAGSLLAISPIFLFIAYEFSASELDVDQVMAFSDEPSRSTTYTVAPSFVDS